MHGVLATMGAFVRAGFRPRTPLARALVPVLLIKVGIVLLAKTFVFDDGRMAVPPDEMQRHFSAPTAKLAPSANDAADASGET